MKSTSPIWDYTRKKIIKYKKHCYIKNIKHTVFFMLCTMTQPTHYISIGYNCDPRIYFAHGIGMTKQTGYLSCPFDLCFSPFHSVCSCIEEDFQHFFDDLKLVPGPNAEGDRSLCGSGELNITNKYGIVFNHESPSHSHLFREGTNEDMYYVKNDFENFKKKYTERICNFRNYIQTRNEIVFVYNPMPNEKWNSKHLERLLKKTYINKKQNLSVSELYVVKLQNECEHQIVDDYIDTDVEDGKQIRYCEKCEKTFV